MEGARGRVGKGVPADEDRPLVRFLGGFDLRVDGEATSADVPVRARALLAYLAVRAGTAVARQRIAYLMWPDSSEGQARTNLRNLLHHLRRAWPGVDAVVEVTPSTLRWLDRPAADVDVVRFVTALDDADRAGRGTEQRATALQSAVNAYAGDLLEGVYEEWLDDERARLRERYVTALRELAATLLATGSAAEGCRVARELVRCEPLAEDHHRLLLSLHAAAGDRAGAVRAFHECAAVLRQDLGVEPAAETVEAYRRLIEDVPADGSPLPPSTPTAPTAPLIGRHHEHGALLGMWRDVRAGAPPRLLLLTGEAGIGKTRLVEELAAECTRQGAVVAKARSYGSEGSLGYGVVTDWLRTPELVTALSRCSRADRVDVSRLLPELAPEGDRSEPSDEVDRPRLFAAVARVLAATNRPLLLVADDAHWADESSLQLLHFLLRSVAAPVLVVATARRESLTQDHALAALVLALQALDRAATVDLPRLTRDETAALAAALGASSPDARAIEVLHRETGGNPLFVVEAVRAGWDAGQTVIDLSPKLQAVIAGRLALLSDDARTVAGVAATAGRAFTADLIREATGLDEAIVVRGLDELWRRGLVEGHEPDGYDFTHGKLRDAAYAALSPAVRTRHHLRLAAAIEATAHDTAAVSGLIASHFDRAGRVDRAVQWYRDAAAHAIRLASHTEAVRLLDRARALVTALPTAESLAAELELLSLVPAALGGVEGFASDRLAEAQQRAASIAARVGAELDPPMLRSLVMTSLCRDEFDDAGAAAERLLAAGVASRDEGLEVEAGYLLGITAFWSGRLDEAAMRFEQVVEQFDPDRHPEHVVRFGHDPRAVCMSRLANTLWLLGRADEAVAARDRASTLADDVDDFVTTMTVRIFAALLALDLDDIESFCRLVPTLDPRDSIGAHAVKTSALLGYLDVLHGRAALGISRIEAAFERCGGRNLAPGFRASVLRVLVAGHSLGSDPAAGVGAADRALSLGGTLLWLPEIRRLRASFLARLGRGPEEVIAELDRAAAEAEAIGAHGHVAKIERTRGLLVSP